MKKQLFALIIGLCLYVPLPLWAMTNEFIKDFLSRHCSITIENNKAQSHTTVITNHKDPIYKGLLKKTLYNQSGDATKLVYDFTMIEDYWQQKIEHAFQRGRIQGLWEKTAREFNAQREIKDLKNKLRKLQQDGYQNRFISGACITIACLLVSKYIWDQFHPDAQYVAPF